MNAPAQTPSAPQSAGYAAGADVVQGMQGQDGMVDNPVIAGFRSIMMLVKELVSRGDPRGQQAAQHVASLLQTLQGAPMQPPIAGAPAQPSGVEAGQEALGPGGPAPEMAAAGSPPMGEPPMPEAPTATTPASPAPNGMAFDPFAAEQEPQRPMRQNRGSKPMHAQLAPQGASSGPVVLT